MYSRTLKYSEMCISSFFAPMTIMPGDLSEVSFIWITVAEVFSPLQLEKSRTAHSEATAHGETVHIREHQNPWNNTGI